MVPVPYVFYRYGPVIRGWSRYAVAEEVKGSTCSDHQAIRILSFFYLDAILFCYFGQSFQLLYRIIYCSNTVLFDLSFGPPYSPGIKYFSPVGINLGD